MSVIPSFLAINHNAVQPETAAWNTDLRSAGYPEHMTPRQTRRLGYGMVDPLSFSGRSVLCATFLTEEQTKSLARRGQPGPSFRLRMHAVLLGATTGKVRATRSWYIARPLGGVVGAGGGRFAVLSPRGIDLYSPSLEPLEQLSFSPEQEAHLWTFSVSPSGESILAVVYYDLGTSFYWIDTASMQLRHTWEDAPAGATISDNELATSLETNATSGELTTHEVSVRKVDGPWRTVCRVRLGQDPTSACGLPQFISNDVLALSASHSLTLIPAMGGDVVLKENFRQDEWIGPLGLRPSADGNRLAVAISSHRGGSELFDINYHSVLRRIMVFDIRSRQWIYTLDAKRQKIKAISGMALSPDGSLIAILSEGVVQVYRLPPGKKGEQQVAR
jgi:hypothetical protein